jgi:DNA-directed RNA polymerase II subunit RPB2
MELYAKLKHQKYCGILNVYTSVVFDFTMKEIRVCTDAGRLVRPLLRVTRNKLHLKKSTLNMINSNELGWDDLVIACKIDQSVIEYIDPEEQSHSLICMTPGELSNSWLMKYTHCEIHPSTIFGLLGSCIPFSDHNQSPRNCYQCAQGKQGMGIYATNFEQRMDKTAYILNYPGRPLVDTRIMPILKFNNIPSGQNIIVAIMTHTGYNMEDSLLINQGSIDRGLFLATVFHTEKDEDKQQTNGTDEIRCKPDMTKTKGLKFGNYTKLNNQGVIPENTRVENRDVILAKVTTIRENRNDLTKTVKYEDQSKLFKTVESETYIDKNYIDRNGDGYNFAKVRLRIIRKPVIGDKFSSRHGQKGTVGNIIPERDMPFTKNGVKPDIIINPHCIPSRMTIAQLMETLLGKIGCEVGSLGDGTPFNETTLEGLAHILRDKLGMEPSGNEILYNGYTGRQMDTSIFVGPCFYQRLRHCSADKLHSRASGPLVMLTRQPAEGRAREGGLRFGEMERDCVAAHGISEFTKERFMECSDAFRCWSCRDCGLIAVANPKDGVWVCRGCGNTTDFSPIEIPYAYKLLLQELETMCISSRILTQSKLMHIAKSKMIQNHSNDE